MNNSNNSLSVGTIFKNLNKSGICIAVQDNCLSVIVRSKANTGKTAAGGAPLH